MQAWRRGALIVEALVCFGIPGFLLFTGLPLLMLAGMSLYLGFELGQLGIVAIFVGGVLGLVGAQRLVRKALRPHIPLRHPTAMMALLCAGAASLGAAAALFGLDTLRLLPAPLAATLHFLYLARREENLRARSQRVVFEVAAPMLIIALAAGSLTAFRPEANPNVVGTDRTRLPDPCMRWFRSGNIPKATVHVDVREADWPELTRVLEAFSRARSLDFHDGGARYGSGSNYLYLSLCSDAGATMLASVHRSRIGPEWEWERDTGVPIFIYSAAENSDWRSLVDPLQQALQAHWPAKTELPP